MDVSSTRHGSLPRPQNESHEKTYHAADEWIDLHVIRINKQRRGQLECLVSFPPNFPSRGVCSSPPLCYCAFPNALFLTDWLPSLPEEQVGHTVLAPSPPFHRSS